VLVIMIVVVPVIMSGIAHLGDTSMLAWACSVGTDVPAAAHGKVEQRGEQRK
jgi:hypothetical protein